MTQHAYRRLDADMPHLRESADWGTDPDSGAVIWRLTSSVALSHNIYCEQPYGSPDGRRLVFFRTHDLLRSCQLLVSDLQARDTTLIEPDVPCEAVGHSAWGEWVYYPMHDGSLRRFSLLTLVREEVLPANALLPYPQTLIQSISVDNQWLLLAERSRTDHFATVALHLESGQRVVVENGLDNLNPHGQFSRDAQPRLMYQLLQGEDNSLVPVFVREFPDGPRRQLPLGGRWSAESTGHMAWIGTTGKVACAVNWNRAQRCHDPRHPQGNLLIAGPDDAQPQVFPAPDCGFYHVSVSRCGRYFVCDDFMHWRATGLQDLRPGPTRIVMGNLQTGKHRVLVADCQNFGIAGCSRYEPDPYLTADNRFVIYNASPFGTMQVFAAAVPPAFLASLD